MTKFFQIFLSFGLFFLIWSTGARLTGNEIILPGPFQILRLGFEMMQTSEYWFSISVTLVRIIIGLSVSVFIGIVLGFLTGISRILRNMLNPIVVSLQSIPSISWLLLALIWFDKQFIPYFIIVIATFPAVMINIQEGILRTDPKLLEMADIFHAGMKKKIRDIYLPSIKGYFFSALKVAIAFGFKVGVMSEILGHTENGIGEKLSWARINVETGEIFVWTITIIVLSAFSDRLFGYFKQRDSE